MNIIRFLKDWTLPVAIALGATVYLLFYYVPQLDGLGNRLGPVIDVIFPVTVFLTLLATFCKVDFHQMRPHRWHIGVLAAQVLLVVTNLGIIFLVGDDLDQQLIWQGVLTCTIAPSASAAPVVTGKLGGNINTMTTFTVISALASALMIPLVFPPLTSTVHLTFFETFLIILQKVSMVLLLPLVLGWLMQHYVKAVCRRIASMPNLSFYLWGVSLTIVAGVTVKNILHSNAPLWLLMVIAALSFVVCFVQFGIGRAIGRHLGEEICSGQALFQKNTSLAIWVAYLYLHPVASVGAGCYVLWQNIINSAELWHYRHTHPTP